MDTVTPRIDGTSQSDKFKELANELGCDEDEARWDERMRRVAKQQPKDVKKPAD